MCAYRCLGEDSGDPLKLYLQVVGITLGFSSLLIHVSSPSLCVFFFCCVLSFSDGFCVALVGFSSCLSLPSTGVYHHSWSTVD